MPGHKAPKAERREQILNAAMKVAARRRLAAITIRDVAKEAGLSSGLVLFHFKSRDGLVRELLDWLLDQNSVLQPEPHLAQHDNCLSQLIRNECLRRVRDRSRTELFFDYWIAGTKRPELRREMRTALRRYRQHFHRLAKAVKKAGGRTGRGAAGMATAAVSFIHGCALQAVIDPDGFDVEAALAIVDRLADHACPSPRTERRSPGRPSRPRRK
jgi:AcrR family transcriptional regulator